MPNNLRDAFFRVAARALDAADALVVSKIQEKAGFLVYHAFESCGGAFCHVRGIAFHPASHPEKLRRFISNVTREKYAREAAALSVELTSLRNVFLYPRSLGGAISMPEDAITHSQAKRLVGRIRALKKRMESSV